MLRGSREIRVSDKGWSYDEKKDVFIDQAGHEYGEGDSIYEAFKDAFWHEKYDQYFQGTKFEGWNGRHENKVIDPDGKVYTNGDDEFWEMALIYRKATGGNY